MIIQSYLKYLHRETELKLQLKKYSNGRLAIRAVDPMTGQEQATLSVNLPDEPLKEDEIFIKDYAENEGAFLTLARAGLVEHLGQVNSGFVKIDKCRWLQSVFDAE